MSAARLVWKSKDYRIVKRDTARWREGVFDVEGRSTDALGGDAWSQIECYSLDGRTNQPAWVADVLRHLDATSS